MRQLWRNISEPTFTFYLYCEAQVSRLVPRSLDEQVTLYSNFLNFRAECNKLTRCWFFAAMRMSIHVSTVKTIPG